MIIVVIKIYKTLIFQLSSSLQYLSSQVLGPVSLFIDTDVCC